MQIIKEKVRPENANSLNSGGYADHFRMDISVRMPIIRKVRPENANFLSSGGYADHFHMDISVGISILKSWRA